jgi:hypothetical protein
VIKINKNKLIKESSLSRIWQHINSDQSFAVISAYRDKEFFKEKYHKQNLSDQEVLQYNLKRHNDLGHYLVTNKYGYIKQKSGYTHEDGTTVEEQSYFIPLIEKNEALQLGKMFDQESILWKDSTIFCLIYTNYKFGQIGIIFRKGSNNDFTFNADIIKYAYSQLIKGNDNQKIVKFAYVMEHINQSVNRAYEFSKQGMMLKEWITII